MLISELIEELEKVKKEHGDLEVKVFDDEGYMGCSVKKLPKFGHEEYKTNTDVMLSAVDFVKRWKRANKKAQEN